MPHLLAFLHNIHRVLQNQQLDYAIFVVEQMSNLTFNKGRMTNIGVLEVCLNVFTKPAKNIYSYCRPLSWITHTVKVSFSLVPFSNI